MPITLITGTPGAGKTLRAVELMEQARKDKRAIFVCGLDGYDEPGVEQLDDPHRWADLPDGALIVVDEAQKFYPKRSQGAGMPPPPIQALSEHRHRGFDFILVTQSPQMVDSYVRKLVGCHEHVRRKFGTHRAVITTWGEAVTDVQGNASLARGVSRLWKYPESLFLLYQSATAHTIKRRVPWRLYALPVLVVGIGFILWYFMRGDGMATVQATEVTKAALADSAPKGAAVAHPSKALKYTSAADYLAAQQPRVDGLPWTAPLYDDRDAEAEPDVYCMAAETRCICHTEQGTRLHLEVGMCRTIASQGVYNPFRKPLRKSEKIARVEPDEDKPPPARRTPAPTMREGGASNGGARDLRPPFFSYESGSYQPMTQYGAERYGGQR